MLRVRDIMTADVATVSPETTVREAMEMLTRRHVSGAPVVSGRSVVGVVTTSDLLAFASTLGGIPSRRVDDIAEAEWEEPEGALDFEDDEESPGEFFSELWDDGGADAGERMSSVDGHKWNALEEHDVSEVMTRDLWAVTSAAPARDAADMMRDHAIHRVLVVDDGELAGIVSALDVARAVAEQKFKTRSYLFNRDGDFGG